MSFESSSSDSANSIENSLPGRDLNKPFANEDEKSHVMSFKIPEKTLVRQDEQRKEDQLAYQDIQASMNGDTEIEGIDVERERAKEELIATTQSFEELGAILEDIGSVKGSLKIYHAEELIDIIKEIREGEKFVDVMTNTYGLRDAVMRILDQQFSPDLVRENPEKALESAGTLFELYKTIDVLHRFTNDSGLVYESHDLIDIIENVKSGNRNIEAITRTHGLRQVVERLLNLEKPESEIGGEAFENPYGIIKKPDELAFAQFDGHNVRESFGLDEQGRSVDIYVNKEALADILLDVGGNQLFNVQGRYFVLANINGMQVPFYMSSKGTDGKEKGSWHPFFGLTQNDETPMFIKGIFEEAKYDFYKNDSINNIREILNDNLKIPQKSVAPNGQIGSGRNAEGTGPAEAIFDLNNHVGYRNCKLEGANPSDFVKEVTGYDPMHVSFSDPESYKVWIKAVIDHMDG